MILIDFGRGQWENKSHSTDVQMEPNAMPIVNTRALDQDTYDYGCLIKDLAQQWMAHMAHTTVPSVLVNVIKLCTCEKNQPSMKTITKMWSDHEQFGDVFPEPYIDGIMAWKSLAKFRENTYSATRSMPAVASNQSRPRYISVENLD